MFPGGLYPQGEDEAGHGAFAVFQLQNPGDIGIPVFFQSELFYKEL